MALISGSRLGPYEIVAPLGAGGMGEVYRARDARLKREVALKILPDSFASDSERLARFQREAEVLASLNHPNIAAIYGLEERALVLELVEGDTLADRIARGAIPLDEALPIARQVAEALEAAHERGIIHRDLKPANIKVTPEGVVKVLDFGLAKLAETGPAKAGHYVPGSGDRSVRPQADLTASPTITTPAIMTGVGMILGTAAYMSPEQAKGREADKRSDIWAFGCVLYEMLTGRRPFAGDDVADTLASILAREPDWSLVPRHTPAGVNLLLRRCLQKDRRLRLAAAGAAPLLIDVGAADPVPVSRSRTPMLLLAMGATVVAAIAIMWSLREVPSRPVTRLTVSVPVEAALSVGGVDRNIAITPDGSRIVYIGGTRDQIFVRSLDSLEPKALYRGSPVGLFVSPDGQWAGFADTLTLKKVNIAGGPAVTIGNVDGASRGATWMPDGSILFATGNSTSGLQRMPPEGGDSAVLTTPDPSKDEGDHLWPEALPDGRGVLFTITRAAGTPDASEIAVIDLETREWKIVLRGGSHAHYVSTGHLLYGGAGSLFAVPFDLERLEVTGTATPVVPNVVTTTFQGLEAVLSSTGVLAYVEGAGARDAQRTFVWVDREGRQAGLDVSPRPYTYPRISPDGLRVTVFLPDQERDIWQWDVARRTLIRATFDRALDAQSAWTPDGRRLVFSSERAGARNIYWQAADGSGSAERLTESPNEQNVSSISPDGSHVIYGETMSATRTDIFQVSLRAPRAPTALVQTPFTERNAVVSPDGRWLAYESDNSGPFEVFVRPYPDVTGGAWQVSTSGGTRPLWGPDGRELFYVGTTGAVMRVGVEAMSSWTASIPVVAVKEGYVTTQGANFGRPYDISPDGRRFLMIAETPEAASSPPQIVVIQNWVEELKRLVPVN